MSVGQSLEIRVWAAVGKHVAADGRVTADAGAVDAALHVDEAAIRKLGAPRILDDPVVTLGCVRAIAFEERRRRKEKRKRTEDSFIMLFSFLSLFSSFIFKFF